MSGAFFSCVFTLLTGPGLSGEWSRYESSPTKLAPGIPWLCFQGQAAITEEQPLPLGIYMSLGVHTLVLTLTLQAL